MSYHKLITIRSRSVWLSPLGCLKKKVWTKPLEEQPRNLIEPCASIVAVCNDLKPEMIVRALITMISGVRKCIDVDRNTFSGE